MTCSGPAMQHQGLTDLAERPMVSTGFKEVIGSWKIIEISLPRIFRISGSGNASSSRPSKRMLPPTTRPGGEAISRRMVKARSRSCRSPTPPPPPAFRPRSR